MKSTKTYAAWATLNAVLAMGCGVVDSYGHAPSEETLCELVPQRTSPMEAVGVLGRPKSLDEMGPDTHLFYIYGDPTVSNSIASLSLWFTNGVLTSETTSNVPFPACWSPADGGTP